MRALLVCVSVSHGNTRRVAEAMAEVLHAEVRAPDELEPDAVRRYDVVGFGSGIFGWAPHRDLEAFVRRLPRVEGTPAFVFATSGTGRIVSRPFTTPIDALLDERGFEVVDRFCCRGYDTWLPLRLVGGINKGRPNDEDLERARAFARRLEIGLAGRGAGPEASGRTVAG